MTIDEQQLRAMLRQEADDCDVIGVDVGSLIAGGRVLKQRRAITRVVLCVGAVTVIVATSALAGTWIHPGDTANPAAMVVNGTAYIADDLGNASADVVLRYTTTDPSPPPLRVDVLTDFENGEWRAPSTPPEMSVNPRVASPPGLGTGGQVEQITVSDNNLAPPHLAAPAPLIAADLGGARWGLDSRSSPNVDGRVYSYEVTYLSPNPAPAQLNQPLRTPASESRFPDELTLDPGTEPVVTQLVATFVPDGASRLEAARLIQAHLRGPDYTYSLSEADPPATTDGNRSGTDFLSRFLVTRRGYCVQFATAMVMMARTLHIPARLAIGFLPGTSEGDRYTVRTDDAHAWPELYFEDIGWLSFEPTPAARVPTVPAYSD